MTIYPNIKLRPLSDTNFEVVEDCYVTVFEFTIQKGAITDLTSAPRWLWWLIPPHGATKKASIVHDYMIRNDVHSVEADSIYLLLLLLEDIPKWQAFLMYFSIQIFKKQRIKHENAVILD